MRCARRLLQVAVDRVRNNLSKEKNIFTPGCCWAVRGNTQVWVWYPAWEPHSLGRCPELHSSCTINST